MYVDIGLDYPLVNKLGAALTLYHSSPVDRLPGFGLHGRSGIPLEVACLHYLSVLGSATRFGSRNVLQLNWVNAFLSKKRFIVFESIG